MPTRTKAARAAGALLLALALALALALPGCCSATPRERTAAAAAKAPARPGSDARRDQRSKTMSEPQEPKALRSGDTAARCKAAAALGARTDDDALGALFDALGGRDEAVRDCVVAALRGQPAAIPFALAEGQRRADALRAAAADTGAAAAAEAATRALGEHLRRAGALQDARLLALVDLGLAAQQPTFVRSGAAWCLAGQRFDAAAAARWQRALGDPDRDVRWPAADGLLRAARSADATGRAAIAGLVEARLAVEADAGVRARLQAVSKLVGVKAP